MDTEKLVFESPSRLIAATKERIKGERKPLMESLMEKKGGANSTDPFVFLSHKHNEVAQLEAVAFVVRQALPSVACYIDWQDEKLPPITNPETAMMIKGRIRSCHRFILVATDAAIASKWCNWELGYGDAHRNPSGRLAVFPLTENSESWIGAEYVGLYPAIMPTPRSATGSQYQVRFPDKKVMTLKEWMA